MVWEVRKGRDGSLQASIRGKSLGSSGAGVEHTLDYPPGERGGWSRSTICPAVRGGRGRPLAERCRCWRPGCITEMVRAQGKWGGGGKGGLRCCCSPVTDEEAEIRLSEL